MGPHEGTVSHSGAHDVILQGWLRLKMEASNRGLFTVLMYIILLAKCLTVCFPICVCACLAVSVLLKVVCLSAVCVTNGCELPGGEKHSFMG